jgi:hypothetical protein
MTFVLNIFWSIEHPKNYFYFLPERVIITTIPIIIAITMKIPKPIPALKIPVMALHELSIKKSRVAVNSRIKFFII